MSARSRILVILVIPLVHTVCLHGPDWITNLLVIRYSLGLSSLGIELTAACADVMAEPPLVLFLTYVGISEGILLSDGIFPNLARSSTSSEWVGVM
jgi:hypothetical protein